jgi:HK97 family phage major capsid protein
MKLHEMLEQRARHIAEMRGIADLAEKESRDLKPDEDKRFGELKTEIADLDKKIGRAQTLAEAERSMPAAQIISGNGRDGQYEVRARSFSITKAMRATLPRDLGGGGVDVGFENEISQEVVRRSGRVFEGIPVPDEVFHVEKRTLLAGSSAADLVPAGHRADLYIDLLRSKLVVARLGGTYLDNLVGSPIDIPRQTGSSQAQWVAEDGSITETDAGFDDVTFTPKTVGAMTSYSRRTMLLASPSIEAITRADLAAVIASAIDLQAIIGDGSANTPTGIIHQADVVDLSTVTGPTWEDVLSFIASIDGADALDGSLGWVTNPHAVAKMRSTLVAASTDSRMVMDSPSALAGYPLLTTTALAGGPPSSPPTTLIFGAWQNVMIGSWSGIDILLNPFEATAYAKGRVKVRVMKDCDVQIRHGSAFAYSDQISLAS